MGHLQDWAGSILYCIKKNVQSFFTMSDNWSLLIFTNMREKVHWLLFSFELERPVILSFYNEHECTNCVFIFSGGLITQT
jgi:hypothetical protein